MLDISDPQRPKEVSAELHQEHVRGWIALGAIALVALTLLVAAYLAAIGDWASGKEVLGYFLPAETTFLGAMGGFYFGTHVKK